MLEMIRCLLMRRIQWRRDKMTSWPHQICSGLVVLNNKWMQEEVTNMWWIWIITLVLAESGTCQAFLVLMELLPYITKELWEKTNQTAIKPPAYTRQPRKPRKVRIKGAEERIDKTRKKWLGRQGMQMRCSICDSTGHNKTPHHRNLPQKEKPLSMGKGRPRKISNQDPAVAADEAKAAARVRRKLAYARAKVAAAAKKAALNASQPNWNRIESIQATENIGS
ncbi:unnamed protein product [Prunus armeniaca]|uniref:Uncharacterized protein n=1 Tax=Prunus armeniaca TaxID=36596 RepID=A0A6J5US10_PRUAR|nr:unnamed protein product [Prunus armeniaca]CAB4308962.1 unnamed protein product [Prunus armeniaca]